MTEKNPLDTRAAARPVDGAVVSEPIVRSLGVAGRELWLATARECPYATYFHTPAWAELMVGAHPPLEIAARAFRLADGSVAVLPLVSCRVHGLLRGFESMVPGVYGGPIARRPLASEEIDAILDQVVNPGVTGLRVFGNPYLEAFCSTPESADDFTHVVDLREGFEAAARRFHKRQRQGARYGREAGLVFARAERLEDFRAYSEVHRRGRERWGDRALSDDRFELFADLHRRADPDVFLWLARKGGRVAGGALWLRWNDQIVDWHHSTDPDFLGDSVMHFLIDQCLREAASMGIAWADLNPSAGLEGVIRFKERFGGSRWYFRHRRRGAGRIARLVRRLERRIGGWRATPGREGP